MKIVKRSSYIPFSRIGDRTQIMMIGEEKTMILNEKAKKALKATEVEKIKEVKIVGAAPDGKGKTFYIGTDGENYFLFTGKACEDPNIYLTTYDGLWDDLEIEY